MAKTLAVLYRPTSFDDVVEQDAIKIILKNQLDTKEVKNAYLFCGGAGTGKTTCARIFAKEINHGQGNPIEMDAASNSGVDDVRNITQQAKMKSLDSEYKVFIIDECHSISNTGWQAFLKLIEEPPAKSIFIFCTTDPQKIPKTILSRVQRYDFHRISQDGIENRLIYILTKEQEKGHDEQDAILYEDAAIEYIAKLADGGMRDAISLMDKCLAYSNLLSLENVVKSLGTADYATMFRFTDTLLALSAKEAISIIESLYAEGKELRTFVKQYIQFLLDIEKLGVGCSWNQISIPRISEYETWFAESDVYIYRDVNSWLSSFINLNSELRWSQSVKTDIEAMILLEMDLFRAE